MPSESDKPIEKQLRDFAARRRDAAGKDAFALHPVTRNALQVEVEREFGRQARFGGPQRSWLTAWWPRLALGGGALVVVAVLAITLVPRGEKGAVGDLAKVETTSQLQAPEPVTSVSGKSVANDAVKALQINLDAATPIALPPAPAQRQEFKFTTRKVSPASAAPTPAASTDTAIKLSAPTSGDKESARRDAAVRQRQQPARAAVAVPPSAPLQGSFQVVILDDRISLVDADQSSYSGRLEPIDPAKASAAGPNRSLTFDERYYKFVQNGQVQQVPVAAQFVLNGTNRTTRLPVQIVGQMVTRTQAVPAQLAATAPKQQSTTPPAIFLQINATATVNGAAPVQIDATTQPQ